MIAGPVIAWGMPSGGELLVILAIVLILFGAKRLPELARSLGQAKKEFQKATKDASEEINKLADNDGTNNPNNKTDVRPK